MWQEKLLFNSKPLISLTNERPSKIGWPNYQESVAYRGTRELLCDKLLVMTIVFITWFLYILFTSLYNFIYFE